MDVTRRCDYACRILQAAYRNGEAYMSVSEIADQQGIPYAFARSIQHDLVKSGGLVLDCDPASTTMLDVLESIQGPVSISACVLDPTCCERQAGCDYNKVWQGADRLLNAYFSSITLEELFEQGVKHPAVSAAITCQHIPANGSHCGARKLSVEAAG